MKVVTLDNTAEAGSAPYESELEQLRRVHDESKQTRRGRAVILHGPRGTGADALLTAFKRELHRRREHVFEGDCLPGGPAYQPLAEVVSRYVRAVEDFGLMTDELTELYQHVGRALGIPRLTALDATAEPARDAGGQILFYEALGQLLTGLSAQMPAVIVLRELHVADSATRAALTYLVQNVVTDPVGSFAPAGMRTAMFGGLLVVSTASEHPATAALTRALGERDSVSFVNLQGATEETVRRFLSSPEVVRRFVDSSGGVADNLEALIESIPKKVEDLFLRRCAELGEAEQEVLGALAVFGKPVQPDLLLRVLSAEPEPSLISGLFEQRIISRRVHRGQLLVDLPTEENRQLVYDRLADPFRSRLHARIASLLEERTRYGEPADQAELAFHYLKGKHPEKAVEYGLTAAERLHISFAYDGAIELLEAILPLIDRPSTRRNVLDRLIDLHGCHSKHRRALFYCGLLKKQLAPEDRGPLYRRVGEMLLELGNYSKALRSLDRARSLIEAAPVSDPERLDERTRIDAVAAEAYYGRGRYERVVEVCHEALNRVLASPNPDAQRQVIGLTNTLGKVSLFQEDYLEATRSFQDNLRRAEEHSWVQEALRARFNLGTIALQRRRHAEAEACFTACLNQGYTAQNPVIRAFCLMNLGVVFHRTHRYEAAMDAYLHGLATFKKSGNELQFAVVAMNLGALYQTVGDRERALALIETSLSVTKSRDIKFYQGWGSYVRGGIALDDGHYDEAERGLANALAIMKELKSQSWIDKIHVRQARLAFERGDLARCVDLVSRIRLDARSVEAKETEAEGLLWLGQARAKAARTPSERRQVTACFLRAREIFEQLDDIERLWFTDLVLAEHFLADDRGAAAKRRLLAAKERIDALGADVPKALKEIFFAEPNRRRVERLLEHSSKRRPSRPIRPLGRPAVADSGYRAWRAGYSRIVGENAKLLQIFRMIDKVADSDSTVLLQGESGTGKELIAEAIHTQSCRSGEPFIKVNCAAFVETLLLSELFGHEKGAFTGAMTRKKGRFELAHGGTLFLDEIGDISPNTQVALLRVLQERTFERVGGSEPIEVDVRVIAATNRNLEEMVRREEFRLDLYYRLKAIIMELPPLRDRRPDVVRLLKHFLDRYQARQVQQSFSREALDFLARYSWPGNVRELENFTRSVTLFVDEPVIDLPHVLQFEEFFADGEVIDELPADFFEQLASAEQAVQAGSDIAVVAEAEGVADSEADSATQSYSNPGEAIMAWAQQEGLGLPELKQRLEAECIKRALTETEGNITKAARLLDMKRPRLSQIINATPELAELKQRLVAS